MDNKYAYKIINSCASHHQSLSSGINIIILVITYLKKSFICNVSCKNNIKQELGKRIVSDYKETGEISAILL